MPSPGSARKYKSEQSGKERPPRLRPLEHRENGQRAARIIFCLTIVVLVLLFALFWTQPGLVQY